jgi:asparagine synthase (glutamine-hydrolysing)
VSAFYDIWISNSDVPKYNRITNKHWHAHTSGTYHSEPSNASFLPYAEYEHNNISLIVLGQFYEAVDPVKLSLHCINHIQKKEMFHDPAGHYLLIVKDNTTSTTHIFTNRLGTYHAYWSNNGGQKIISTYYLGIAKQLRNKVLDWEALSNFFAMGYFPRHQTYLTGISILLPASCYSFDADLNLMDHHKYWTWEHQPQKTDRDETIAHLNEILTSSISYATQSTKTAIPISGGLDSRMIAGILAKENLQRNDHWAYSYGYNKRSQEIKIASEIAATYNIPFNDYTLPNYLFKELNYITDAVELFQYIDGTRQASMRNILPQKADLVIGGHWGDVWMDNFNLAGSTQEEIMHNFFDKKLVKKGSDWLLKEVCSPFINKPKDIVLNNYREHIAQYNDIEDITFKLKAYKTDTWSFRWTLASIRMFQATVFPVLPFYDSRVVDLFCNVSTSLTQDRLLQIEFIKELYPELASIKWDQYDANLYNYKNARNNTITYRAVNKLKRILTGDKGITRNWEVFYLNAEGRKYLTELLLTPALTNIVSSPKIKSLIDRLYKDPSANNGYSISMLLTFSLFLQEINE